MRSVTFEDVAMIVGSPFGGNSRGSLASGISMSVNGKFRPLQLVIRPERGYVRVVTA
jgi:hypothetical protein